MINKKAVYILTIILMITAAVSTVIYGCTDNNDDIRNVVYEDMQSAFEEANLFSSNIGIFTKTEQDGSITYGECGSGVVFKKENGAYYALTSAHVVSTENAQLLVFTVNTEMETENIPGIDSFNVLSRDAYEAMYTAEIMYVSSRDDLAVIRFSADEDLSVIQLDDSDPQKGDRIMCVGNPQSEWFSISYGKVTSGMEKFGEYEGFPSNVMKHSAYIQVGSSGGAAVGEQMKLIGITPGAGLSLNGKTFKYGVLIPVSEIKICLNDWNEP